MCYIYRRCHLASCTAFADQSRTLGGSVLTSEASRTAAGARSITIPPSQVATTADPNWTPLLAAPPYPEYVSGYSGLVGVFTRALEGTFHTQHLQLTFITTAADVPEDKRQRIYDSGNVAVQEVVDARM